MLSPFFPPSPPSPLSPPSLSCPLQDLMLSQVPTSSLLDRFDALAGEAEYPYTVLEKLEEEGGVHTIRGCSLLCRLEDGTRAGDFNKPFSVDSYPRKVEQRYLRKNRCLLLQ